MKKFNIVRETTFYCQSCGKHTTFVITPNVKTKALKCGYCKADSEKLVRVKK